jgi:hypothetical protein
MAIGRISGSVLKANLTRNGTDLAFETNLLYLDVTNSRIGIGTSSPSTELDVDGTITGTTVTGGTLTASGTGTSALLTLTTTEASASASPIIALKRNSGSPADSDKLGQLSFLGENDNDQEVEYGRIYSSIFDASDGTEDGKIQVQVMKAGTLTNSMRFEQDGIFLNTSNTIIFEGATADNYETTLTVVDPTADVTVSLPNATTTLVGTDTTDTLTNKTLTSPIINTGTFGTSILPTSADGTTLGSASKEFSDLFLADGGVIKLGNDQEITITHVADTGILLEDSGGTPTLQLHDSNESIASDGSKVIITSGGTAFSLPTSDGSNGDALTTNGSGVLSFTTISGGINIDGGSAESTYGAITAIDGGDAT